MQAIIDQIQASVKAVQADASFVHGRPADTSLESIFKDTSNVFAFLDPLRKVRSLRASTLDYSVSIGFLRQDKPSSSTQERDAIVEAMDIIADAFIDHFDDNSGHYIDIINTDPAYRIKSVCTGVLLTFQLKTARPC